MRKVFFVELNGKGHKIVYCNPKMFLGRHLKKQKLGLIKKMCIVPMSEMLC
jgi:hypothetical protein